MYSVLELHAPLTSRLLKALAAALSLPGPLAVNSGAPSPSLQMSPGSHILVLLCTAASLWGVRAGRHLLGDLLSLWARWCFSTCTSVRIIMKGSARATVSSLLQAFASTQSCGCVIVPSVSLLWLTLCNSRTPRQAFPLSANLHLPSTALLCTQGSAVPSQLGHTCLCKQMQELLFLLLAPVVSPLSQTFCCCSLHASCNCVHTFLRPAAHFGCNYTIPTDILSLPDAF